MKKVDEFRALCPGPRAPKHKKGLRLTAKAGTAAGRWVKGPVLTVALWDECQAPLLIWYFDKTGSWTGCRRGVKDAGLRDIRVEYAKDRKGRRLDCAEIKTENQDVQALREFFPEHGALPWNILYAAQHEEQVRKLAERAKQQREENEAMLQELPRLPADLESRAIRACRDSVFLWFRRDRETVILPGGVTEKQPVQRVRCDCCNAEYTLPVGPSSAGTLRHLEVSRCKSCGAVLRAHDASRGAKGKEREKKYLMSQVTKDALWLRKFDASIHFENARVCMELYENELYRIGRDGQVRRWKNATPWKEAHWERLQSRDMGMAFTTFGGYYYRQYCEWEPQLEKDVLDWLDVGWTTDYIVHQDIFDAILIYQKLKTVPMMESLIKTGWGEELMKLFHGGYINQQLNLRSATYYGVFGLNRQEMKVAGKDHKLEKVFTARSWKRVGLPVTEQNMQMVAGIYCARDLQRYCADYGTGKVLKYLRHCSRKAGAKDGKIKGQAASDWLDYIYMARSLKLDMDLEYNRFPPDLKRRHDELAVRLKEINAMQRTKDNRKYIEKRGAEVEKKFGLGKILKGLGPYEYANAEYCILAPKHAGEIITDSEFLSHCVASSERYYERIAARESYILFLRKAKAPEIPWYTLEVEPGGTVRQKRSYGNEQYKDLDAAKPFLAEWQAQLAEKLGETEQELARKSKSLRLEEFRELKKSQTKIRTGRLAGKLLVDELIADLMENQVG